MNRLAIWISIFSTVVAWCQLLPFYGNRSFGFGTFLVCIAVFFMCLTLAVNRSEEKKTKIDLTSFFRPFPSAMYGVFVVMTAQALCAATYIYISADQHQVTILTYPVYWILKACGYPCSLGDGVVHIWTSQFVIPFSTNVEKLALFPTFLFFMAAALAILLGNGKKKVRMLFVAVSVCTAAVVLRFVLLMGVFAEFQNPFQEHPFKVGLFVDPILNMLFVAFLAYVCSRLIPIRLSPECYRWSAAGGLKKNGVPCALGIVGVFLLTGAILFQDPGTMKDGHILFDDYHSGRWEKTTVKMGKFDFGGDIVYSYSSLAYWLRHYYQVSVNTEKTLDQLDLKSYAIVVLKTPASRYSNAEIEHLETYVKEGGGLFIIGDHSNLLGMTTFLNQVAGRFDFEFNYDSSNQFSTNFFSDYRGTGPWAHPTVNDLDFFSFLTSCTLQAPLFSEKGMIGFDIFSDRIDYSKPSFFGDIIITPDDDFGIFTLGASKKVGKGRVVLFTDSTVFSNFCLFVDDHEKYFLNSIDYLNRLNRFGYTINFACMIGGVLLLTIAFFLQRSHWHFMVLLLPLLIWMGVTAGLLVWGAVNRANYQLPEANIPFTRVAFLAKNTEFFLPPGLGTQLIPPEVSFDTFFVSLQRLGLFPFYTKDLCEAVSDTKAIVIINPIDSFSPGEIESLRTYVAGGGNLVVMDTIMNREPKLHQLLHSFGIGLKRTTRRIEFEKGEIRRFLLNRKNINLDSQITTCIQKMEKGKVVAVSDSRAFSRIGLGGVLDPDNHTKRQVFRVIYEIFEKTLNLRPFLSYP